MVSSMSGLDSVVMSRRPRLARRRSRKSELLRVLLFLIVCGEQQRQEEEEVERRSRLEWQRMEEEHRRRAELLAERRRALQSEAAELEELERLRLRRARLAAAAVAAAAATQQGVHRRLWVKSRSQAWWERCSDPGSFPDSEFHRAFRMTRRTFDIICDELGLAVAKEDTMLRQAIPVRQRVAVCIWRLATGEPLRLVSKRFGLGISTCHKLVLEVCAAINEVLLPRYVRWPSEERLRTAIEEFEVVSGIPNLVGGMYTTHIPIIAPKIDVAAYYNKRHTGRNQKTSYSITLQGVVDTRGVFTDLSIGWPGSMSDEKILENSNLYKRAAGGSLNGLMVAGGAGYPLLDWLLVPYTQHNLGWAQHAFNQKLAEVLKIGRGAFGRLKGRWRFLQKRTEVKLQELPAVLGACSVLHNVCEQHNERFDPELAFEAEDDPMLPESMSWDPAAAQARDAIAHNLLHGGHAGRTLL